MARDVMDRDAGSYVGLALDEADATRVNAPNQRDNVVDIERAAKPGVIHATAGLHTRSPHPEDRGLRSKGRSRRFGLGAKRKIGCVGEGLG